MINSPNLLSLPYLSGYSGNAGNSAGLTRTALSVPYPSNNGYNANFFNNQYVGGGLNSGGGMGSVFSQLLNTFISMFTEMFNATGQGNPFGQFGASPYPSPMDNSGSGMPMNGGSSPMDPGYGYAAGGAGQYPSPMDNFGSGMPMNMPMNGGPYPMDPGYGYPSGGMGPYGSALMDSSGYGMPPGYGMPTNGGYPQSGFNNYPPSNMYPPPAQDANPGQACPFTQPPVQQDTNSGQVFNLFPSVAQPQYPPSPILANGPQPLFNGVTPRPGSRDMDPPPVHHHFRGGHQNNQVINNINVYNPPPPPPVQQDTNPGPMPYCPPVQQDTAPPPPPPVQQDTNPSYYPRPPVRNNLTINNVYVYNQAPVQQDTTPTPTPPPPPPSYNDQNNGYYQGDPHFAGFGGEKYDVMGQNGKTYNILSDKGLQYNATFGKLDGTLDGTTTIQKAGITSGKDHLEMDLHGTPQLNGQAMEANKQYTLDNKGQAQWDGKFLNFGNSEYTISLGDDPTDKNALRSDVKIKDGVNPLADGVAPHGLLGQTADGVAGQHKGVNNQNVLTQGGTVIDGSFDQYEVNGLFDTGFKSFNRFSGAAATA